MKVQFFLSPAEFGKWLAKHHGVARELWVGYYKRGSGKLSLTWPESVDEALCYGWIDGIRKSVDDVSYTIRFTPRSPSSVWSRVNIDRARKLTKEGRMRPAGLEAFRTQRENRAGGYSYERRPELLEEPYQGMLRKNEAAWTFFQAQPPWCRRAATWWVISAKKEETRLRRLARLIEDSASGRTIPALTRKPPL